MGLVYEDDGKTPKNASEVFDMSYEEYEEYKEKIIPIAKNRSIDYAEIAEFMKDLRREDKEDVVDQMVEDRHL